jgi:predicted RNase H-like HicB family nuclease
LIGIAFCKSHDIFGIAGVEKAGPNYSAYVPDLPGCIATGDTVDEVKREIAEAIRFHIEGMIEDGEPVPPPVSRAEYVET